MHGESSPVFHGDSGEAGRPLDIFNNRKHTRIQCEHSWVLTYALIIKENLYFLKWTQYYHHWFMVKIKGDKMIRDPWSV